MGSFREKNREGVKEMQENSRETTELGSEMTEQADQINAVLESIELQDEEDVQYLVDSIRYEYWRNYTSEGGRAVSLQGCE